MEATVGSQRTWSLSFLELLDRTFRLYRDNFSTYLGVSAAVIIPLSIINLLISGLNSAAVTPGLTTSSRNAALASGSALICLGSIVTFIVSIFQFVYTYGPMVYTASEQQMGRKVTVGEAFAGRKQRFATLGAGFIVFSILIGLFAVAISFGALALRCVPGLALLGLVFFFGTAIYALLPGVLILENGPTSSAINRAWNLGKRRFWTIFGVLVVTGIITSVISFAFGALAQWLVLSNLPYASAARLIVSGFVTIVVTVFTTPIMPIASTLMYYDARTRVEGFDLALQTLDTPNARPWDVPVPSLSGAMTGTDWRNLAIILVVTLVIMLLFGATASTLINSLLPLSGANLAR